MKPLKYHETHYTKKLVKLLPDILGGDYIRLEGVTTGDGFSDIIGFNSDDTFTAIEVKKGKAKTTPLQRRFLTWSPASYVTRIYKDNDNFVYAIAYPYGKSECLHPDFEVELGKER